ncbi:DEAD/DEAH box helicase [Cnuibacter physcomitrellae]|uniref:DEAD/DEAH box helicase n=1 Tax=Cnuibacter physcomitrellae TaxID=1619308 RepID=UPI002175B57F|nr:DEAD/DEAH box helicase [Cnuibacter physcomitrellae]MCS5495932.1 DEAD/DEAH box helicase [Cnuibacter physcomitrellae]
MPKTNKTGGFKAPKNYEPNRGARGTKPGSRSAGHRGYRPAEEGEAPRKQRWTTSDREARADRDARTGRAPRDDSFGRDRSDRSERFERSGRDAGARGGRDDRAGYGRGARFGRDGGAGTGRDDRGARGGFSRDGGADARGARRFDRDDRFAGRDDRGARGGAPRDGERGARFGRDDRFAGRDDRGGRGGYTRDERPARGDRFERDGGAERPARSFDRSDRPARSFDRSERPARSFDRADRPERSERPARSYDRADRPARSFDRDDRGPRRYERTDRPERSFDRGDRGDRPRRDRDDRAPRQYGERSDRRGSDLYPSRDDRPAFTPQDDVVLERLEAQATEAKDVEGVTFGDLGLGNNIVRALAELGAESPFPIQAATIPEVLAGRDVLGRGRTGSGKTIAFGAPLVEKLMENNGGQKRQMGRKPRALILAPTRELALQIDRTVQPIARSVGLFTTQIYGGVPQGRQVGALQRGVDIVIGTPGRIEDLINQGRLDLSEVAITVLDEADHMCDLGFLEPVQRILRETKEGGQKLLFSATLDRGVAALVEEFLVEPAVHEVAGEDQASSTIEHRVLVVEHRDKDAIIERLADREGKTLIFARTRAYAERLADQLEDAGIFATSLHGDLNQSRRTRNLERLTSGRVSVLVATDVAARGIHVDDIDLVIQADAPDEYKTYLHRAGRTGRAGKRGTVVTLIPRTRRRRMDDLLGRAEIEADTTFAAPGDQVLEDLAAPQA